MPNVVIYVKQADWDALEQEKQDPAKWVRGLVARAFEKRNEKQESHELPTDYWETAQ